MQQETRLQGHSAVQAHGTLVLTLPRRFEFIQCAAPRLGRNDANCVEIAGTD